MSILVSHGGLNVHFPGDKQFATSFHRIICPCIFCGQKYVQIFLLDCFLFVEFESFLHILGQFFFFNLICILQILSLVYGLCFHFLNNVFLKIDFHFGEVEFINFFFHVLCFWCHI